MAGLEMKFYLLRLLDKTGSEKQRIHCVNGSKFIRLSNLDHDTCNIYINLV